MNLPAPARDTLGCLSSHLLRDQSISADGVRFHRKTMDQPQFHQVETEASARGVLVGISLRDGHRRCIFDGRGASNHDFDQGSIYIRGFHDRYRADIQQPFDFVLLEISDAMLERTIEENAGKRARGVDRESSVKDDVLFHLARALTPALETPAIASTLFVDQMGFAMVDRIVVAHGGATSALSSANRRLPRLLEARAKEMLRSRMDGNLSIAEIADACGLSRSHFTRAFRETTGHTPHQWLIAERLAQASALLKDLRVPLADVAAACGFSDQSHFTRAFSRHLGVPPGHWRKMNA